MKEKIENQRGNKEDYSIIPEICRVGEWYRQDIGFYTVNKEKEVCRAELLMWYINVSVTRRKWGAAQDVEIYKQS